MTRQARQACQGLHPEIALLVGGELPPARQREVEEHLATCAACRALAAALEGDRRLLQGLADEPVDDAALDRIRSRVRAAIGQEGRSPRGRVHATASRRRFLLGLAAVLATLGLGLTLWLAGLRPDTVEPTRLADRNPPAAAGPGSSPSGAPAGAPTGRGSGPSAVAPDRPEGAMPVPPSIPAPGIDRAATASRPAPALPTPPAGGTRSAARSRPAAAPGGTGEAPDVLAAGSLAGAVAPPAELDPDAVLSTQAALDALGPQQEPSITIQVVSDDPDIVFYWLVDEPKEVTDDEAV